VVVTNPSHQAHVNQVCTRPGHTAAQAERSKVTEFRWIEKDFSQYDFVPFGASAQSFLKQLSMVAASRGTVFQSAFDRSASKCELCTAARVETDVWAAVV
jgi:hypothetical protein